MRFLLSLLSLVFAIAVVLVAVNNNFDVTLVLWPFPIMLHPPAYLLLLAPMALGAILGALAAWLAGGKKRQELRIQRRKVAELDREVRILKSRIPEKDGKAEKDKPQIAA